jgi:hypothetical protein
VGSNCQVLNTEFVAVTLTASLHLATTTTTTLLHLLHPARVKQLWLWKATQQKGLLSEMA